MSKTKVYSTRLSFEEELDKMAMDILDSLDQASNGTEGFRTTHWIREAVLLRVEMQRFMLKETGNELHPKQYEDLKSWLLHLAEPVPVETKEVKDPLQGLDPAQVLDGQVGQHLGQMDEEHKQTWMLDAVRMRFAIEHHAPAYFINQYQNNQAASVAAPVVYSDIEDPGVLQEAVAEEDHIEADPEPEPSPQPTWSPYVLHLRNAIPAFIQQTSLGAMQ
ncbi:hypothetical protein RB620_24700 [Paenibacillus sp. LHD-117]|uniref:hypothetical protein n=1 Tax=Paenibacillus sp. LHD-117 TaxID=3071412 RepID=UPI0027DFABC7|nr:hypothetical protein [Paenibacillus sp. LHD-117]MDQ6422637.1 hypothetical protein [Paenibacillus sp. LHD-117]